MDEQDTFIILDDEEVEFEQQRPDESALRAILEKALEARDIGDLTDEQYEAVEKRVNKLLDKCGKLVENIKRFMETCAEDAAERRRQEEAAAQEPELDWREVESLGWKVRTIGLDQGAFQIKQMFEDGLLNQDWTGIARRCIERYSPEELEFSWVQILKSGALKSMPTIFPIEANPVVVPGFLIAPEGGGSDDKVFVIVNQESPTKFRYTPTTVVRLSEIPS